MRGIYPELDSKKGVFCVLLRNCVTVTIFLVCSPIQSAEKNNRSLSLLASITDAQGRGAADSKT